jgi:hypothetical protein
MQSCLLLVRRSCCSEHSGYNACQDLQTVCMGRLHCQGGLLRVVLCALPVRCARSAVRAASFVLSALHMKVLIVVDPHYSLRWQVIR